MSKVDWMSEIVSLAEICDFRLLTPQLTYCVMGNLSEARHSHQNRSFGGWLSKGEKFDLKCPHSLDSITGRANFEVNGYPTLL